MSFYPSGNNKLCPSSDWTCPYYNQGWCEMDMPEVECDDYMYYSEEDEEGD